MRPNLMKKRVKWMAVVITVFSSAYALNASALMAGEAPRHLRRPMPEHLLNWQFGDHAYFRPNGSDVSGFPKNTAKYHRSPCPALNTLANHGYLPRNGKDVTASMIQEAITKVFGIDASLAEKLTAPLPSQLSLADLGEHNFIEHDASLVHDDAFFRHDPSIVNQTLVTELLHMAQDSTLTKRSVGRFRHEREAQCAKENPEYSFTLQQQATAYGEAAVLLLAMGDAATETISTAHAQSFLLEEKIPADYTKPKDPITLTKALYVAAQIKFLSRWPWNTEEE